MIKPEMTKIMKHKNLANLCCILFGPSDPNEKSSKLSALLTTKSQNNLVIESITDAFNI
jgi:hypothetical protein